MGFGDNGGFDFTKELKEILKKRRDLEPMVDLVVQRKKEN